MRSCLARAMPTTIGSTVSRWLGLADSSTSTSLPERLDVLADLAEVVLHVARALGRLRVDAALELLEHLVVALADDVGEHVEAAAVRHAHDDAVEVVVGRRLEDGVEDRDRRLGALEAEALLADVLGAEERLERLGGVELGEDVALVLEGEVGVAPLRPAPGSSAAPRAPGCACTRCRSCGSRRRAACRRISPSGSALGAAEAAGEELAVEVPDGEPVGGRIELRLHLRLLPGQRVEVGDEVAAHAVDADERVDGDLLGEHRLLAVDRVDVAPPLHRLVGHAEGPEDRVVEAVAAEQQLLHLLEEQPRLGALDDAVVVGGGERDDLRHAEVGERRRVGAVVRRPDSRCCRRRRWRPGPA